MNYEIVNLEQRTPEWYAFRKNHLGSSDVNCVMGLSPWKKRNELWKEKLGLIGESEPSYAMLRGIQLEPIAREQFCEQLNIELYPVIAKSKYNSFMAASYDGVDKTRNLAVEIKCPVNPAQNEDIPLHYMPQLQHQMFVLDLEYIYYFCYHPEHSFHKMVKRDNTYITEMLHKEHEFWDKVLAFEIPDPEEYRNKEDDKNWKFYADMLISLRKQRKDLEKQEKEILDKLVNISENEPSRSSLFKLDKVIRKGSIDYDTIMKQHNIDTEMYRKPDITYWKLSEEK
jgi:putative phage-type endonuclease